VVEHAVLSEFVVGEVRGGRQDPIVRPGVIANERE
jgi:hypothetical protein